MITIVGAGSTTGAALIPMLLEETDEKLQLLSSRPLAYDHERVQMHVVNVRDKNVLKQTIMAAMPQMVINLAAMTNVDKCESERQMAWDLNVTLVENLARITRVLDAKMVHISTDYVFDGTKGPYTETSVPNPINYYGKSKLAGENICVAGNANSLVIRTNVIYGPPRERPDFVRWVLDALDSQTPIRVVDDQIGNPTYVDDLAEVIMRLGMSRRTGLYHAGGADFLSRYDFALKIAEFFKLDPSIISRVTTAELAQPARRPLRLGLISLKAETDLRMRLRGVDSGLTSIRQYVVRHREELL
ncbi:MAG TPA: dTDP-4-dehydrorhamnose reductase [Bacteroidetes bacterium]|nr:dTDP-4-dehydrorhamnose reductase [Bacteroidota bacterium]